MADEEDERFQTKVGEGELGQHFAYEAPAAEPARTDPAFHALVTALYEAEDSLPEGLKRLLDDRDFDSLFEVWKRSRG